MVYTELSCQLPENNQDIDLSEIIIAELSELGFESFLTEDNVLKAYIQERDNVLDTISEPLKQLSEQYKYTYTIKSIQPENWNAKWESEFKPVVIGNDIHVRATFHQPNPNIKLDIIIEPKMAFGTGHHQTTSLMAASMLNYDFKNKTVCDMGCGTGILAIVAEKLGAKQVTAVDIDEWAYNNILENIELNSCGNITAYQGDCHKVTGELFDVYLANINRNIILEDITYYAACLKKEGKLLLSGFYQQDFDIINKAAETQQLKYFSKTEKDNWISVTYEKI